MQKMKRFLSIVVTVCMLMSILSTGVLAVSISTKPADGTTKGQPFAPGTGGSANFRIPGIVTLDDGTLIAACDARWNHAGDGAGLDTIVSVSKDNGENWTYTFANYLGDNGNTYNNLSTCIIDPGIGTDGETAYLIADLWPAGIALNTSRYSPVAGENGFDNEGHLLLRALSEDSVVIGDNGYNTMAGQVSRYKFYLDLETLKLHNADGSEIEGYTVDAFFNITGEGVDTNLFFADSPYQPYPTDYLYMTTSTDGLNWSEPTLLNLQEDAEQTLLVGPGNGTYDEKNDRIIFTAYEHTSGYERTSLIWMDSEGNWHRSEDATNNPNNKSSEATAVVLEDGTVRVFYRDWATVLNYSDYVWSEEENNYVVSQSEVSTTAPKRSNNQLTSILYSERIDGKEVILVACAANPSDRRDGHLYVFLVNEDKTMDLAYAYDIIPGEDETYAYNCITELNDGNIALLYENAGSQITYLVIDMADVLIRDNDPSLTVKAFELMEGETATFIDNSGYHKDAILTELDPAVAEVELTGGETTTNAAKVLGSGANIDLDSCQYTFTKMDDGYFEVSAVTEDGTTVYLNHFSTSSNNIPNVTSPAGKIAVLDSDHENMFKLQAQIIEGAGSGAARGLHFHAELSSPYWNRCGNDSTYKCHEYLFRKAADGETSSTEIPGYVMITSLEEVVDGEYLIAAKNDAGNWYVLNPSTSTSSMNHIAQIMGSTTVGYTEITFTGIGKGYTEVVIGSTLYKVTVNGPTRVNLQAGESVTIKDETGYYVGADVSALDTSVATVEITGEITGYKNVLSESVTAIEDGKTYVMYNKAARKLVSNEWADASVGGGGTDGLSLGSTKDNFDENDLWTVTAVEGGYYVQDQAGKYLSIAHGKAEVKDNAVVIDLDFDGTDWTIGENGQYANDFGGAHTAVAGWRDINDTNSQWELYEVKTVTVGTTAITFTGVGAGETSVMIGNELYAITVTDDGTHKHVYEAVVTAPTCTEGGYTTYTCECGYSYIDDETDALGHTEETIPAVEATFDTTGLTEGKKCSVCGEILVAQQTISALDYNEGIVPISALTATAGDVDNHGAANQGPAEFVLDDDLTTMWHTDWYGTSRANHWIQFELSDWYAVSGLRYKPRTDLNRQNELQLNGTIIKYDIQVSNDGVNFTSISTGEWDANSNWKVAEFEAQTAKYIRLVAVDACTDNDSVFASAAEIRLVGVETEAPLCTHTKTETRNAKAATCTEAGYTGDTYCADCDEKLAEGEAIAALGHTEEVLAAKAPTCTEKGLTEGKKCSVCNEILAQQEEIPALGHDFVNGDCSRCDAVLDAPFEDVPVGAFYFDPVKWAVEKGVTTGATETTFNPNGNCQRAQVVTFLWRAAGSPEPTSTENPFTDVKEGDFYYKAVLWAVEKKITNGISATEFGPFALCNRAQVVTFLWRAQGSPASTADVDFTDVKDGQFYSTAVAWAVEKGITNGMSADTFGVETVCNRAQVVTFLYRTLVK